MQFGCLEMKTDFNVSCLFRYATDAVPVMLGAIFLFVVPADFKAFFSGKYEPILAWKKVVSRLPWEFVLFAGCMMALMKLSEV